MATKYADRAFISVNGARLADLESGELKQNFNSKEVPTMSNDGFNRGYVQGNRTIDITCSLAVQNQLGRPKLEAIDFENNDIQITWIVGADQFTATGVFIKDVADNAGGVGDEVKANFSFGALRLTDLTGNSSLFNLSL